MRNLTCGLMLVVLLLSSWSCEALLGILSPTLVAVALVNDSDYPVDVTLFIDDEQLMPGFLLTETGTELEFTVQPGETTTFTRDCDDLQAIVIEDADLRMVGGLGPEANTDVLRDGDDFGCGDVIVFTFSHSITIFDFDITTEIR